MSEETASPAVQPEIFGAEDHIHHIALSVANLKDSAAWYREKLGFRERRRIDWRDPDGTVRDFVVLLEAGRFYMELMAVPNSVENADAFVPYNAAAHIRGYVHGSFQVADAWETQERLAARGVQTQRHLAWAAQMAVYDLKVAWFWDLEGNLFQLRSGIDPSGTDVLPPQTATEE